MIKKVCSLVPVMLFFFLMIPVSSAHVTMEPQEATLGDQHYWIYVPTEKEVPTVEVRVVVPDRVDVTGILPVAGWKHSEKKQAISPSNKARNDSEAQEEENDEKITEITWSGGQIQPGEYMLFGIETRYTGTAEKITWKTYQKYADGQVVAWDGSDEKEPAPSVHMVEQSSLDVMGNKVTALENETLRQNNSAVTTPIFIIVSLALVLSVIALILSLKGRKMEIK